MSIEYSNELYKKYAELCLDKQQYNSLVKAGIFPANLENIYAGSYGGLSTGFTRISAKKGPYKGAVPSAVASLGESLFLEDWNKYSHKKDTCMLVYRNFLVICSEPEMEIINSTLKPNNILPVAIPLYRIVNVSISEDKDYKYNPIFKLNITFDNNQVYSAILFRRISYQNGYGTDLGTYLQGINWSFESNQILLSNALSYSPGDESYNQNIIANVLKKLVNQSINFSKVENAILSLGCNTNITKKLISESYINEAHLVFALLDHLNDLKEVKCDANLIDKLEDIGIIHKKLTKELRELDKQLKEILVELKNKKKSLETATFFKRKRIKEEIYSLEKKVKEYNDKMENIYISPEKIDEVYDYLMKQSGMVSCDIGINKNKKALELYEMCSKRGIESINTEDDQILFEAICKSLNIVNNEKTKKLLEYGKKLHYENNNNNKKNNKEIMLKKISDEESYNLEKNNIKFIGKNKYLFEINSKVKEKEAMSQILDLGYRTGQLASQTKAVKSDEYILGGLANGIAGGAAALATVSDIREKNAQAEINAQIKREQGNNLMRDSISMKSSLISDLCSLEKQKNEIDSKLCDTEHTDKYFEYLDCKVTNYEINISGYLTLSVEVNFKKEPTIKKLPIVIDGSLLINVLHNNKIAGKAFLNAPGFNVTSIDKIGFNYKQKYYVIALPIDGDFIENTDYNFEIKPINIWMIEK